MGWKSIAWTGLLVPALAGCGALRHAAPGVSDDNVPSRTRLGIERDQRRDARAAWQAVGARHTDRAFSTEFRDGFLDGYAAYLDRGEAAQPPAVSPASFVQNKTSSSSEDGGLIRDYYIGFQYGGEVAGANVRRPAPITLPTEPVRPAPITPTVPYVPPAWSNPNSKPTPAPLPHSGPSAPGTNTGKFDTIDSWSPEGSGKPVPPLPKPELPVIKPFTPTLPGDTKLAPLPVPPAPDRLPLPVPPSSRPDPLPVPAPPGTLVPPAPTPNVPLPPPGASAPSFLGEVPVIPFQFAPVPVPPVVVLSPQK
ncbi:hypothetical protein J8F10_22965 [Gemmata sp. G18]|uniref:Uncharacterized protein n=1 Tax=Gemmata palustris TaxID=2822762 RepID=A0ABS5BWL0_9BACT|nr:hypothetical protein [Gemmata palustris]MBP3958120.1 hypothetical protein [Gemmata palustris]